MDDSRSVLKFIKIILLVAIVTMSVYWCILLMIVASMLLGHVHRPDPTSGAEANYAHTSMMLIFLAVMSVIGTGLAILVMLFYWVSCLLKEFDQQNVTRGMGRQGM